MIYPFMARLANLGVQSRGHQILDHRVLDLDGSWTLAGDAPIRNSDGQLSGWISGLTVEDRTLWAIGQTGDGDLAEDLAMSRRMLSMSMDSLQFAWREGSCSISAGRVRSALVVDPSGYIWRVS